MPPTSTSSKKRRADDISDNEGLGGASKKTKSKKLTKEEKAALRQRAAQAMGQQGGASASASTSAASATSGGAGSPPPSQQPKKRRKLNTTSPTPVAAPAPAPASSPTPATTTPNKKMSRKEAQKLARERARIAMMNDSSAPKPASPPPTTTTTAPAVAAPVPAPAPTPTTTTQSAKKAPTAAKASTSTSRRRPVATTATTTGGGAAPTTIPNPPASFPTPPPPAAANSAATGTTATGQQTMEVPAAFTQTVLQQPPAAPTTSPPLAPTTIPGTAPQVVVVQQPAPFVPAAAAAAAAPPVAAADDAFGDEVDDNNGAATASVFANFKRNIKPVHVIVLSMVVWLFCVRLVMTDSIKYNPKSGMLMILGTTRIRYKRKTTKDKGYTIADTPPIDLAEVAASSKTICYQDSPLHVLETVAAQILESIVAPEDCSLTATTTTTPCPSNAICYRGTWLDCQAPVWELFQQQDDEKEAEDSSTKSTTPLCVLSGAVNTTYAEIVELLEVWSIQEMCGSSIDGEGIKPKTYYVENTTDGGLILAAEGGALEQQQPSINKRIPLYSWSTVFKEGPESLDPAYWDWDLLRLVNKAHASHEAGSEQPRLVLDDEFHITTTESVGLSPTQFQLVERTKLPSQCKLTRRLFGIVDAIGSITMNLIFGVFSYGWIFITVTARTIWYCTCQYPLLTIPTLLILAFVAWYKHYKWIQDRNHKLFRAARWKTIDHLKRARTDTNVQPGINLRKGEVAMMQVRDQICENLYLDVAGGGPTPRQKENFILEIWPQVCLSIRHDNRVSKESRLVGSTKREVWMWIASTTTTTEED